jgi:hypothetical protein
MSVRRADGTKRYYYLLRRTEWDKRQKRQIARYLAYIGPRPLITLEKAQKIAQRLGITLNDLRKVRRLGIIEPHTPAGSEANSGALSAPPLAGK